MSIDPKLLKPPKAKKTKLTHVKLPKRLVGLLRAHNANLSKICQEALDHALKTAVMPASEETVQVPFKYEAAKLEQVRAFKLNMRQVIEDYFERLAKKL